MEFFGFFQSKVKITVYYLEIFLEKPFYSLEKPVKKLVKINKDSIDVRNM